MLCELTNNWFLRGGGVYEVMKKHNKDKNK